MHHGSHLPGSVVSGKIVPARSARGCVGLTELAAAEIWSPAPLEMVGFSLPKSVRQAKQRSLAQCSGRFHNVRLVAGMAGIGDLANGEYVCDGVYYNLGRLDHSWYENHGLRFDDSGHCEYFASKGEVLQVANAISFFGWENRNYAHWLSEKLGRFYWIEQLHLPQDTVVLVEAGLPASIMETLAIFWPVERTICVPIGHACEVKVLHHFSDTADIWEPCAGYIYRGDEYHVYPPAIAWMARKVKGHCSAADGQGESKIYLVRPPRGNGRTIVNQKGLIRELCLDGFQIFQPESHDFATQVRTLACCELAVLGSGAAAANLLWMQQGSTLVMLIQDNPRMWYWFFHVLAAAVGVRLVYFPVKEVSGTHNTVFHLSVEAPIESLRQWLAQCVRQTGQKYSEQPLDVATLESEATGQDHRAMPDMLTSESCGDRSVDCVEGTHAALIALETKIEESLPLVSVCIAAYNHESYIGEALDSVLAQSYSNIEILVVDDASSDKSAAVIEDYAARYPCRFRTLLLTENEGPSRAANRLFAMAQGEFVALLGSDDRMLPRRIERQVAYLLANADCVGVFTYIAEINAQGQRSATPTGREGLFNQPIIHLRRQLLTGNFLNAPSAMIRRHDLLGAGGYDPLLRYVQDYDLWGRLLLRGELVRLPECLTEYRVHGANLSIFGQDGPNFASRCETVETIVRFVRDWPLETILPLSSVFDEEERARGQLELAGVLELVDRNFFGKPSLATAYAYQLTLVAGKQLYQLALSAKQHLERCLDEGFHAQWQPFAWFDGSAPDWFAECSRASGRAVSSGKLSAWLAARVPTPIQLQLVEDYLSQNAGGPQFGILVLDLQGDTLQLMKTIRSLRYEQVLHVPAQIIVLTVGAPQTKSDTKLHFVSVSSDNYIDAINEVCRTADFDWLMLVNAGEEFTPSGLMIAALDLLDSGRCRAVYGDELQRLVDGELGAIFRPVFNLDMLLSFPKVIARHWLFRREVVVELGGFDTRFASAFEFDLLLRLIEQEGMSGLGHVDEPLLITTPPTLIDCAEEKAALLAHLQRRGYSKAELLPSLPGRYRIKYGHLQQPLVSIIVPTKDQLPMLQRCVESLLEKTAYANYELLIVDNASKSQEAKAWLDCVEGMGEDRVRVLRYPHPFNYSAINNMAAREARGEYLVLLNNDTAVISDSWLDELLNHAQRPEVGIVGAKLLYPDGRIQHAGVILGLRGPAEHPFIGEAIDSPGYMNRLQVDQNYSAVTAACLMIRKSIYDEVGGLDEEVFKVSYNDVDLCLKVRQLGYLTVWTPHAVVMHEGSVSQNQVDTAALGEKRKRFLAEQAAMYEKWLPQLANDPAYNANLALDQGFALERNTGLTWRPLPWRPLPVVLAHNADPWGCGHYRIIKPFEAMRDEALIDGALSERLLGVPELARLSPDVIVFQRQTNPQSMELMAGAKRFSSAFKIYELDDYLPNAPMKSVHRANMSKDLVRLLRQGLSFVDRFVVSTQALADEFKGYHSRIHVVENRLPLDWWGNLTLSVNEGFRPRVGWAGGVGHQGDLEMIADVVRDLAEEVDWVFLGMCPDKLVPYVAEFYPGMDIGLYPQFLADLRLDLALAPLEENVFNVCKSNLRLLEYGICGFPVIASDIVSYRGSLPVTLVKNRYRDWVEAIRGALAERSALRVEGQRLQAAVKREWMLSGDNLKLWQRAWLPD